MLLLTRHYLHTTTPLTSVTIVVMEVDPPDNGPSELVVSGSSRPLRVPFQRAPRGREQVDRRELTTWDVSEKQVELETWLRQHPVKVRLHSPDGTTLLLGNLDNKLCGEYAEAHLIVCENEGRMDEVYLEIGYYRANQLNTPYKRGHVNYTNDQGVQVRVERECLWTFRFTMAQLGEVKLGTYSTEPVERQDLDSTYAESCYTIMADKKPDQRVLQRY